MTASALTLWRIQRHSGRRCGTMPASRARRAPRPSSSTPMKCRVPSSSPLPASTTRKTFSSNATTRPRSSSGARTRSGGRFRGASSIQPWPASSHSIATPELSRATASPPSCPTCPKRSPACWARRQPAPSGLPARPTSALPVCSTASARSNPRYWSLSMDITTMASRIGCSISSRRSSPSSPR